MRPDRRRHARPTASCPWPATRTTGASSRSATTARADPRAQLSLLARAGREPAAGTASAAYPDGGWWVLRAGEAYVLARCGDVGVDGEGTHAHNDLLAFEFAAGRQPLVIDPGSYVYSSDPAARNAFRATAAHATLRIGGAEQRPIPADGLFALPDVPQRLVAWEPDAAGGARWVAEHEGFPALPGRTRHRRELVLAPDGALAIADTVELGAPQPLEWGFPLAPGATAAVEGAGVVARIGAVELRIEGAGVEWSVEPGRASPSYGVAVGSPVVRARRPGPAGSSATAFRLVASAPAE